MKRWVLVTAILAWAGLASAQKVSIPELYSWLNEPQSGIDTVLRHRGYLLMQKDADPSNSLFVYSHMEHEPDAPAISRSVTYGEVTTSNFKSRLITYRTYSKAEYQELMSYLLQHNFVSTRVFDFKDSKHVIYDNGQQSIRVKINRVVLKDGRKFISYELEVGK